MEKHNTKEINVPVVQEDHLGCGVACTAFILDINYQEALRLFKDGGLRVKTIANFYCKEIVRILNSTGLNYEYRYTKGKSKRKINESKSIVFIKRSKKYPAGHYLCRTQEGWMDPWINYPSRNRKAGFRRRLPWKPIYMIFSTV